MDIINWAILFCYWRTEFHLIRTALVVGAVVLINDDGILHSSHNNVAKHNVCNKAIAWPRPRLYPYAVVGSDENRVRQRHILHSIFLFILPQAANAAKMIHTS